MTTRDDDDLYHSIEIDWCRCPLLESVPGKVSGAWVIEGTRMPAQTIVDNHDACMDPPEIAAAWDLDRAAVEAIVAFAADYRAGALGRIVAGPEFAALLDGAPAPPPVDWRGCAVVEWMDGPFHDTWVLRGTPTPADMLMRHHDDGMPLEEIVEHYRWDEALVAALMGPLGGRRVERGHRDRAAMRSRARPNGRPSRPPVRKPAGHSQGAVPQHVVRGVDLLYVEARPAGVGVVPPHQRDPGGPKFRGA